MLHFTQGSKAHGSITVYQDEYEYGKEPIIDGVNV